MGKDESFEGRIAEVFLHPLDLVFSSGRVIPWCGVEDIGVIHLSKVIKRFNRIGDGIH